MSGDTDQIASCEFCSCQMDVSVLAPFTNVQCPECGAQTRVKVELDQYVLKRRQGVGGMSLVFAAKDKNLGREVAIKILNEDYSSDANRISQFEREAMITAGISHPNVVRVYTVGKAFNRYYIAMELVSGQSMEQIMAERGALPETEVISKMHQVTEGLNAAYKVGLIHRDIKPGNILIDNLDMAKIVDFGLALVTQGGVATAEEIWATPYYVPPEALEGQPEDFRSDVYALSATIYHALAGKPPFTAETRSTRELAEIKKSLPRLKSVAPWLSDSICAVIDKGMQYDPNNRFASYEEMLNAIQFAEDSIGVEGAALPVHGASRANRSKGIPAKYKVIIPLVLGTLILLIGGIFIIKTIQQSHPETTEETDTRDKGDKDKPDRGTVEFDENLERSINQGYASIHSNLTKKNYFKAYDSSLGLLRLKGHPEPSATVSGLHSIILKYLDGKPKQARDAIRDIDAHAQKANFNNNAGFKKSDLRRALLKLQGLGSYPLEEFVFKQGHKTIDTNIILAFAFGLKNCEQGNWQYAKQCFQYVKDKNPKNLSRHADILREYKTLAKAYLADIESLKILDSSDPSFTELPKTEELINELKARIAAIKMKTRMQRGPWLIQLALKKCDQALARLKEKKKPIVVEPKPNPNPVNQQKTFHEEVKRLAPLIADRDFDKLRAKIKSAILTTEIDKKRRLTYLKMLEKAEAFYKSVLQSAAGKVAPATMPDVIDQEGQEYLFDRSKPMSKEGIWTIQDGKSVPLRWADVSPASLLRFYNMVVDQMAPFERLDVMEEAACFAFVTEQLEMSKNVAARRAEEDTTFEKNWKDKMLLLKKE